MLRSTSALLRPGTQSRPQVVQSVTFTYSPHLSNAKTCRITKPIGTPAEGRHTYTQYMPW